MGPVPAPVLDRSISLLTLTRLGTGIGLLLFPSEMGRDDEDRLNRVFHYTTYDAWVSMQKGGFILPSMRSGYAWFTPTIYDNGSAARSDLSLDKTPQGYISFDQMNVRRPVIWGPVAPDNDQPGGGIEGRTAAPIPIAGARWVSFCP